MKPKELKILIERYYEGKTSEEEELTLKKFFTGDDISEGFEAERKIFGYYSLMEEIREPSARLKVKIMETIDKNISASKRDKKGKFIIYMLSTAAAFLILAGSYFFFVNTTEPADTFAEPETAYAETLKILCNVSSKLNKGTRTLKPLSTIYEAGSISLRAISRSAATVEEKMNYLDYRLNSIDNIDQPPFEKSNK